VLGVGVVVGRAVAVVGREVEVVVVPPWDGAAPDVGSPVDEQDATSRPTTAAVPAQPAFTARV
jgi:hypothetical protein